MNLTTHLCFGMLLTLIFTTLLNPGIDLQTLNLYLTAAAIGSLLPDIDHPKAYISRRHWMMHGLSSFLGWFITHRGITHTLLSLVTFTSAGCLLLKHLQLDVLLTLPFALGYLSHLLADSLNPAGVRWLYPFRQHKTKPDRKILFIPLKIKTGSIRERLLQALTGTTLLYLYARLFMYWLV